MDDLAQQIIERMSAKGLKLAVAESCTGGMICAELTSIPGSSAVLVGGVVAYANEVKVNMLGVSEESLVAHGAVSEQVAAEMAQGALERFNADIAISTTGIAGPDGGTKEKPVGLVCIGLATKSAAGSIVCHFDGGRNDVRQQAVAAALELLLVELA